jgi:hypothetical protein
LTKGGDNHRKRQRLYAVGRPEMFIDRRVCLKDQKPVLFAALVGCDPVELSEAGLAAGF